MRRFVGIGGAVSVFGNVAVVDALLLPARVTVLKPFKAGERVLVAKASFEEVFASEVAVCFGLYG